MLCHLPACPAAAQMCLCSPLLYPGSSPASLVGGYGSSWRIMSETLIASFQCSALQLAYLKCCPGGVSGADRICGHFSASLSPPRSVHVLFQLGLLQPGLLAGAGWDLSSG